MSDGSDQVMKQENTVGVKPWAGGGVSHRPEVILSSCFTLLSLVNAAIFAFPNLSSGEKI